MLEASVATARYQPTAGAFQLPAATRAGPLTIRFDRRRLLRAADRMGVDVHYWTVNDPDSMRHLLELGADGLITDHPERAVAVMRELGMR